MKQILGYTSLATASRYVHMRLARSSDHILTRIDTRSEVPRPPNYTGRLTQIAGRPRPWIWVGAGTMGLGHSCRSNDAD